MTRRDRYRCKGCDALGRVLVDGYCSECRQLRLPINRALKLGAKPVPVHGCDDCGLRAEFTFPDGSRKCARHASAGGRLTRVERRSLTGKP